MTGLLSSNTLSILDDIHTKMNETIILGLSVKSIIYDAVRCDRIDILRYFLSVGFKFDYSIYSFVNSIESIKFFYEEAGITIDNAEIALDLFKNIVLKDNVQMLEYFMEEINTKLADNIRINLDSPKLYLNIFLVNILPQGHISCIKYLHEKQGLIFKNSHLLSAYTHGFYDSFVYIFMNDVKSDHEYAVNKNSYRRSEESDKKKFGLLKGLSSECIKNRLKIIAEQNRISDFINELEGVGSV